MILVTPAEPKHSEAIAKVAEEMDRFYGAARDETLGVRVRQIHEALFRDPPVAYALLAWIADRLVGFATYSFLWPAVGLTRSLYLKELYVCDAARRAGVGRALMRALFETAATCSCTRVEWTTDDDNVGAQAFYASLGFHEQRSKVLYRAEGVDLIKPPPPRSDPGGGHP